jgi:DNA-binding FadR family transcriptional regulator/DNA-binding XRE family transcriptional regulator
LARAVHRRQQLFRKLADWRKRVTTQVAVADVMGTSQPAVARLERGGVDPRLSTLERWAAAVGATVHWRLEVDEEAVADSSHLRMTEVRGARAAVLGVDGLDRAQRLRRVRPMVESISHQRQRKEAEAARLAAQNRTAADLQRLDAALDALRDLPGAGLTPEQLPVFRSAGRNFHLAVAAASHKDELCAEITQLLDELYEWLGQNVPHRRGQRSLHVAIVEAIRNRDAEGAAAAMMAHSKNSLQALDELLLHQLPIRHVTAVLGMRTYAEGLAARLAARRHTPYDDQRLREARNLIREIPADGVDSRVAAAAFRDADRTLHMAVAHAAHDPLVYDLVDVVYRHFSDLLSGLGPHLEGFHLRLKTDHATILDAILEGRPDDADEAAREHVAATQEAIEELLMARWGVTANR